VLYSILIEFSIPTKILGLIKMFQRNLFSSPNT